MIKYRLARSSDAPELHRLNELFNGEGCNTLGAIEESLKSNEQEIVCVASDGKKLAGFCCGQIFKSICYSVSYAEITEIFILAEYRRQGIGRQLMMFMESEFKKSGIDNFQVFTGKSNTAAQAFYRSMGYSRTTEILFRRRKWNV